MPVDLPVRRLAQHCNPFRATPWGLRVTKAQVRQALRERRLVSVPGTEDHAGRIAYLVENTASDPIEIDVGVPALGCWVDWLVQDGNHRLAAAIFAGHPLISAGVAGQLDYAQELFGVDCTEPDGSDGCSASPVVMPTKEM